MNSQPEEMCECGHYRKDHWSTVGGYGDGSHRVHSVACVKGGRMNAKYKDFEEWLKKYDKNGYFRDEELDYLHDAWNASREGMPDPEAVRALVEAAEELEDVADEYSADQTFNTPIYFFPPNKMCEWVQPVDRDTAKRLNRALAQARAALAPWKEAKHE
jgi:hypothetical protein